MSKIPRSAVLVAVGVIAGAIIATGTTVAIEAGATGTTTTYYACLSTKGALSKVGMTSPTTCPKTSTVINWNSQGPQGDPGPAAVAAASSSSSSTSVALSTQMMITVASATITTIGSESVIADAAIDDVNGPTGAAGRVTCQLSVDGSPFGLPASVLFDGNGRVGSFNIPLMGQTSVLAAGTHSVAAACETAGFAGGTATGTITVTVAQSS